MPEIITKKAEILPVGRIYSDNEIAQLRASAITEMGMPNANPLAISNKLNQLLSENEINKKNKAHNDSIRKEAAEKLDKMAGRR